MHFFKPATHRGGRIPCLLLSYLLIVASAGVNPAHADGVSGTINNGQTINGTVVGQGSDTYSFNVTGGSSFVVSVAETGPHNATFMPRIDVLPPGSNDGTGIWRPLHARFVKTNAADGKWSVKVSRAEAGGSGGSYALTLIELPGTLSPSSGIAGGALSAGANPGTNIRGQVDVWTFSGVAGHTVTLTLNQTGGGKGFDPEMNIFTPTGGDAGAFDCVQSCDEDIPIKTSGLYTVLAWRKDTNDVTGTYTLSVKDKN